MAAIRSTLLPIVLVAVALPFAAAAESPPKPASAEPAAAVVAPPAEEAFTLMNNMSRKGLHDFKDESWNAYGQITFITSWKPSFAAPYTNANGSNNSLLPDAESSFTGTATLYLGLKLWPGGEAYFAPEVITERPFSQLHGLAGAIQNFELQKTGGEAPQLYRSRVYLRQVIDLGGESVERHSDVLQLGTKDRRRRLILTVGNFTILDLFDKNSFTSDTRQQFLSLSFMTYAAWDFGSDARGYSWGGAAEFDYDDWAIRFGRTSPPKYPNQLPISLRFDREYGDSLELEHDHKLFGREGAVKVLAYRNREFMGRFDESIAALRADPARNAAACTNSLYLSTNASAPDLCWVRRLNIKVGIGLNLEQHLTEDAGVFFRGMISDGATEVQAYTSTDRSISFGGLTKGSVWKRPADLAGIGASIGWISRAHADFLGLGGVDGFIGDGKLNQAAEEAFEVFYSLNFLDVFWLSADYQRIVNPAFNADRGPVNVFGLRLHAQY